VRTLRTLRTGTAENVRTLRRESEFQRAHALSASAFLGVRTFSALTSSAPQRYAIIRATMLLKAYIL
jgi:hypothetical protein